MYRSPVRSQRRRALAASRGRVSPATTNRSGAGTARPPPRLDVGAVERIEQVPEDLGLADERRHAAGLQLVRGGVGQHVIDRLRGGLPRLRRARAEVLARALAP